MYTSAIYVSYIYDVTVCVIQYYTDQWLKQEKHVDQVFDRLVLISGNSPLFKTQIS